MPNILDQWPYPWTDKVAQQLHIMLCQVSPGSKNTILVAEKNGIDTTQIILDQAAYMLWVDIINQAALNGLLRNIVKDIFSRLNVNSPARPFFEQLLGDKPVIPDAEPRGVDGAPVFIKDTDEIKDPEALLYRDDLMLETGKIPQLIAILQKMISLSPAVCRLVVNIHGVGQFGTGFRIGPDMLLTNWHVLHRASNGVKATAVTAEFLYEDDGAGGILTAKPIKCDINTIVTNQADDWGIIKVIEPMDNAWPIIKLTESVSPVKEAPAFIIQHPRGDRKRIGYVRNQVSDFDDRVVQYLTDTESGSSGSPVFDITGKLFALHHAGGRPQEVLGKLPMTKNEGINIAKVKEGLQNNGVAFP